MVHKYRVRSKLGYQEFGTIFDMFVLIHILSKKLF